jgi:hypothetical protein
MNFRKSNNLILAIFAIFLLNFHQSSCKKKQIATDSKEATQIKSVDFLQKKLAQKSNSDLKYLNAKANVAMESSNNTTQATVNIIWVRDSFLWFNVKKFGIEGARGLITRDSLFLINRIEKNYMAKSWTWVEQEFNLPAGFELVAPVILGNPFFLEEITLQSGIKEQNHQLSGANHRFAEDFRISEGSFLLKSMTFMEPKDAKSVSFSFENHQKTDKFGEFSYLRRIDTFSPELGASQLTLELSDVEFNIPKSWKFEIPSHYTKMEDGGR